MTKRLLLYVSLVLMIIVWAFSFIVVDIAVDFMAPLSFALYRFTLVSITFLFIDFCLFLRYLTKSEENEQKLSLKKRIIPSFSKKQWLYLVIASFTGISIFFFAQYSSIQLIGPSLPALFVCLLAPVLISLLALIFFNENLNKLKILGFIIATIGGYFLVTGGDISNLALNSPNFLGYFLALLTPVLWAIYTIITKRIIQEIQTLTVLKVVAYFGTIELLILVIVDNQFISFLENSLRIPILLSGFYVGVICYILGYYVWQNSQKQLQSSKVASFLYIEPFITLIASLILKIDEVIVLWNILGGVIVLIGVILINYR
ncbi:MAG: putative amino-acid metabolite efflux pump [Promethearchaeota archaeon]|nr:MAG: putative amino-acid metabolite efflux pump [Candidatus Lokiarchaeota archaeon]